MSYLLGNITMLVILVSVSLIYNVFFFSLASIFFYKYIKKNKKTFLR